MVSEHGHVVKHCGLCFEHTAVTVRVERNEEDIKDAWRAIDRLRTWIMTSAAASVLTLIGIIGQIIFKKLGLF